MWLLPYLRGAISQGLRIISVILSTPIKLLSKKKFEGPQRKEQSTFNDIFDNSDDSLIIVLFQ
ncbi:MAG: hypothetical protein ABI861_08350 [Panacibacter sp.]